MKRLQIDFAPASLRRTLWQAPRASWAPLLIGLILCGAALLQFDAYRAAGDELEAQLAALRARAAPLPSAPAAPSAPLSAQQAAALNAAIMQLNLPWRALHDAVGAATPDSIALLALEPDARKRVLRISAEAKNSADMLAYVVALGQQDGLAGVTLVRHEVMEQDPNRPLRFQIDAGWGAP